MSNYPLGFGAQEQADYFGRPHDSYAERQRERDEAEALIERARYADTWDKRTDPDVMELRAKWAHDLRASRKAREVREILSTTLELIED